MEIKDAGSVSSLRVTKSLIRKNKIIFSTISSTKFEIEKFNGKNNFELWKLKMRDLLV